MFEFREEDHTYWLEVKGCKERLPSVTEILNEWRLVQLNGGGYYVNTYTGATVRADVFEAAGEHGTAVHKAAKLLLLGGAGALDWDALHVDLVHPLREFLRWVDDCKLKVSWIEQPMHDGAVAGTPDIIGTTSASSLMSVIDIKTGGIGAVGPQTAKYAYIFRKYTRYKGNMARFVLGLPKQGPYTCLQLRNPQDLGYFNALHFAWKYRMKNAA